MTDLGKSIPPCLHLEGFLHHCLQSVRLTTARRLMIDVEPDASPVKSWVLLLFFFFTFQGSRREQVS